MIYYYFGTLSFFLVNEMVRRRFISKGNATIIDGLDKTALKSVSIIQYAFFNSPHLIEN